LKRSALEERERGEVLEVAVKKEGGKREITSGY